jgi:hypothetical protein
VPEPAAKGPAGRFVVIDGHFGHRILLADEFDLMGQAPQGHFYERRRGQRCRVQKDPGPEGPLECPSG